MPALNTVTLTWSLEDILQTTVTDPCTIEVRPVYVLSDATNGKVIITQPRTQAFSGGTGSMAGIVANDNALVPVGSGYAISVVDNTTMAVLVPEFTAVINFSNGASQDLSALLANPGTVNPVYTQYMPKAGGTFIGATVSQIPNVAFDGDSLVAGSGVLFAGQFPRGQDYPSQVVGSLDPRGSYYNVGVGGETMATMVANAAANVDSLLVPGRNNIVVIAGGSNDIAITGIDVNPYSLIVTYCQARRAAGWKVVVGTIGPRTDATISADFETKRLACNASILANWSTFADAVADFGGDPVIGITATVANPVYYTGDGAHLTFNGYAIRAAIAKTALASLGVQGMLGADKLAPVGDMWIPANQMYILSGTPAYGIMPVTIYPAYTLSHGQTANAVGCSFLMPMEWRQANVFPVFARSGSASGNVRIAGSSFPSSIAAASPIVLPIPANYSSAYSWGYNITVAPGAGTIINSPALTALLGSAAVQPRYNYNFLLKRDGTHVADTCTDDIYLLGLYIARSL